MNSPASQLLHDAKAVGRGVGAFNVVLLEHAEGIVAGAEATAVPVILQISENCIRYHGSLAPIVCAAIRLAQRATIPVVVHLDHIESVELIEEGLDLGVDSVMFDGSKLEYDANVRTTRRVVELCHAKGVHVEAELGEVGGKDGVHSAGVRTDPREAKQFVEDTGVDALAVAVGSSHAMTTRDASVDLRLIRRLANAVAVPLVLHGSSGLPDSELRAAVESGITKVNISTHLNGVFSAEVRRALAANPDAVDPRYYIGAGRGVLATETSRLLTLLTF